MVEQVVDQRAQMGDIRRYKGRPCGLQKGGVLLLLAGDGVDQDHRELGR
jgi:hypothetical protein